MSTDPDPKPPKDSQNPLQNLLVKCGFHRASLSVRDRHASEETPNRPVMPNADSKDKKRKRTSDSPATKSKTIFKMEEFRETVNANSREKSLKTFDDHLQDIEAQAEYLKRRTKYVEDETKEAWDSEARDIASLNERIATEILRQLREYERVFVFKNIASEAIPGEDTLDMGGQFLTNKQRIETESKIYQIAKDVPKGALLHLHFNAELHPELLLIFARTRENMYVRSIRPLLTKNDLDLTEMVFNVMDPAVVGDKVNIFSVDYPGNGANFKDPAIQSKIWMRWEKFQDEFMKRFPGEYEQLPQEIQRSEIFEAGNLELSAAENWIKQKMVLSEEEAYGRTQTVNGVWARFNQATRCFKGLLNYEAAYEWYIDKAIDRMIDEKVMYAELRPMLLDPSIPSSTGVKGTELDHVKQMELITEMVNRKKKLLKDEGRENAFPFGLKIIYCTPRSIPKPMMQKEMRNCINLKNQFPELICGFDLVGAEDRPNHIGHYMEELVAFQKACKDNGREIPFLFHAGETLLDTGGSSDPKNSNLFDAVALSSKRIGHGFSLLKHPQLVEKFKKTADGPGICIELCPISNELLHLCRNIKEHPYPELLAAGIPCTVNSDNPSLFSNSMSHEFYQIIVGAPTMSVHSWKQLALWSLEYSCLSDAEKRKGKAIFMDDWEAFCNKVVQEYRELFDTVLRDEEVQAIGSARTHTILQKQEVLQLNKDRADKAYDVQTVPRIS